MDAIENDRDLSMSWACRHHNGLIHGTRGLVEVKSHVVVIIKPSTIELDNIETNKKLVLDARLFERVLTTPIFTEKSIPLRCQLAFSQALKDDLYKVIIDPRSVGAWVQLLILPRCTLQMVKPHNRLDHRYGNQNSLQQHHILECCATPEKRI